MDSQQGVPTDDSTRNQAGEKECMLCGCARVSTLTGGIEKNMSLCAECDEVINDRLLKRMSPKTKEEEEDHAYGCDEDDCEDGTPHLGS